MSTHAPSNRPGRSLRAVVVLLLALGVFALLAAAYLASRPRAEAGVGEPTPPAPSAPASQAVMLQFTLVTIPSASESNPTAANLLQAIGGAPDARADAATVQSWLAEITTLAGSRLATIQSRPRIAIASGQEAAIEVQASAAASAHKLRIAVTPRVADDGSTLLALRVESKSAEGLLELWAKEAGLALGPSATIERDVAVLPGGGAGLVAAIRSRAGREGWLVVIVEPSVMPPAASSVPTEQP